jgi:hypothetical protein
MINDNTTWGYIHSYSYTERPNIKSQLPVQRTYILESE